ncbi:MAG: hypothetical protein ACTHNY_02645 [Solirubrobacterales bacterium]
MSGSAFTASQLLLRDEVDVRTVIRNVDDFCFAARVYLSIGGNLGIKAMDDAAGNVEEKSPIRGYASKFGAPSCHFKRFRPVEAHIQDSFDHEGH